MQLVLDTFVLAAADIINGQAGPFSFPPNTTTFRAMFRNGNGQVRDVDYVVNGNYLSWNALPLSGILGAGDTVMALYEKTSGDASFTVQGREERTLIFLTATDISNKYVKFSAQGGAVSPIRVAVRNAPDLASCPSNYTQIAFTSVSGFDYVTGIGDADADILNTLPRPLVFTPTLSANGPVNVTVNWYNCALQNILSAGDAMEVAYSIPDPVGGKRGYRRREVFTADQDVANTGQIVLSRRLMSGTDVELVIRSAPHQALDIDYTVLSDTIIFGGWPLGSMLGPGDILEVYYYSADSLTDLYKKNEDYSYANQVREWAANPRWTDDYARVWDFISAAQDATWARIREKTANFVMNLRDPDLANYRALESLAKEIDVPGSFNIPIDVVPPDLERLINIFSVGRQHVLQQGRFLSDGTISGLLSSDFRTTKYPFDQFGVTSSQFYSNGLLVSSSGNLYPNQPDRFLVDQTAAITYSGQDYAPFVNVSAYMHNEMSPTGQLDAWALTGSIFRSTSAQAFFEDTAYLNFMREHFFLHLRDKLVYLYADIDLTADYSASPTLLVLQNDKQEAYEYLRFLDAMWPCSGFCYRPSVSSEIIRAASYMLTDACLRVSYRRDSMKLAAQRFSIAGTNLGAQKLTEEDLRRNFTKPSCWRLMSPDFAYVSAALAGGTEQRESCVASTTADFIMEQFLPDFCGMRDLKVQVVEYFDRTDYLNLSASSLTKRGGNQRFWEGMDMLANSGYANLGMAGKTPITISGQVWFANEYYPTTGAVLSAFLTEYNIPSDLFTPFPDTLIASSLTALSYPSASATVSGLLFNSYYRELLPAIWNAYAINGLSGAPVELPDLAQIVEPNLVSTNMISAELRYTGAPSGALPPLNLKNVTYPTVAPAESMHNLVEKPVFGVTIPLTETIMPSQAIQVQITGDISDIGMPIKSWRARNQELAGYQTAFEQSFNLDYNQNENPGVDRDGPFVPVALRTLLTAISGGTFNFTTDSWPLLSGFFDIAYGWMSPKLQEQAWESTSQRCSVWCGASGVLSLSGTDYRDIDQMDPVSGVAFVELSGTKLDQHCWDQLGNRYFLYKSNDTSGNVSPSGRVFSRRGNEPLPFPVSVPWIIATTSGDILDDIAFYGSYKSGDTVYAQAAASNSVLIMRQNLSNTEEVADYRTLSGYARLTDWRPTNLKMTTGPGWQGLDNALQKCYYIGSNQDVLFAVGATLSASPALSALQERDALFIFSVSNQEIVGLGGTGCCNSGITETLKIPTVESMENRVFRVIDLGAAGTGWKKFAGTYLWDKYWVFVLVNSTTLGNMEIELIWYDMDTSEISDPDLSDLCDVIEPYVPVPEKGFISTWDTTKISTDSSTDTQIKLPLISSGDYDCYVSWGDGSQDYITSYNQAETTHTYTATGIYTIEIKGKCWGWSFNNSGDRLKILDISQWGNGFRLGNDNSQFYGCGNLELTAVDALDLTDTTDLQSMFANCSSLSTAPTMLLWDTSNIMNMSYMFIGCVNFNQSVSSFDTSNVTDMSFMFAGCFIFNQSVSNFDTSNVTSMYAMFNVCYVFNQSVSNFDTSNVTDMSYMFNACVNFNQSVSNFDTSNVTDMSFMFNVCLVFNQSVSNFDTSNVTDMSYMFNDCLVFNQSVSNFDTSNVTDMSYMFNDCLVFNQSVSNFDTSNVTDMSYMFNNCLVFNQSVSNFDTSNVTDMTRMFAHCWAFNQVVSNFDTSNVTNMSYMFQASSSFNQSVSNFDTSKVTNMGHMFESCPAFNQSVSNFDTSKVTDMSYMFASCAAFKQNLNGFSVIAATTLNNMLASANINATGTTTRYDALLNAWGAQGVKSGVPFNAGTSKYSATGSAARTHLINIHGWTILDGGL